MNKENMKPKFTIRSPRRRKRDVRHHNPGTKRRPPTPRVRVLSSITLVPPRDIQVPVAPSTSVHREDNEAPIRFEPPPPQLPGPWDAKEPSLPSATPWQLPKSEEIPPTNSPGTKNQSLNPTPTVDYQEEFKIVPGPAYQSVPIYINRDMPWRVRPIDIPVQRKIRFYRNDARDPRMHDLHVEVVPIDAPSTSQPREPESHLFQSPRPIVEPSTTSSDPLDELIRLLDRTYGCPRPRPARQPEPRPPTPSAPSPPADTSRLSDSLQALVQLAKLFAGPSQETATAYRRFKRPPRPGRR